MTQGAKHVPRISILGTRVDMAPMDKIISLMGRWIEEEPDRHHHVVMTGMHGIMEAHRDPGFKNILNSTAILAPDGVLALLVARIYGHRIRKQDTGPELLWRFSETAHRKTYRYFFYGDTEHTLYLLSAKVAEQFPNIRIVGAYSPPFRTLTPEEDAEIVQTINQAEAHVLWVGLGMPKQEQWIFDHRDELKVPVVVGAGASFKFLSGTTTRAPAWWRNLGFEWLWRLVKEPRRVWRRVLVDAPQFIGLVILQITGLRKYG